MRYHWTFKTLAFLLALLAGCCFALSAAGVVYLAENDGFLPSDELPRMMHLSDLQLLAKDKLRENYLEINADLPADILMQYNQFSPYTGLAGAGLQHQVLMGDDHGPIPPEGAVACYVYETSMVFPKLYKLDSFNYPNYTSFQNGSWRYQDLTWRGPDGEIHPAPTLDVPYQLTLLSDGFRYRIDMANVTCVAYIYVPAVTLSRLMDYPHIYAPALLLQAPYVTLTVAVMSLLLLLGSSCYLCCAAGRGPKVSQPTPRGLHKLPMDLMLVLSGSGIIGLGYAVYSILRYSTLVPFLIMAFLLCAVIGLICLVVMTAFAAQVKTPGHYLLKRSVTGLVATRLWKILLFVLRKVLKLATAGARLCVKLYAQLPLMAQWLITGSILVLILAAGFISGFRNSSFLPILVGISLFLCVIVYGSYCFSLLLGGAKKVRSGELYHKIRSDNLLGCFKDFADELNSLSQTVEEASQKRMQSERMKSELITNVSHDLKTPLTSIINYVDLLRRPHTDQEQEQYLEVLQRQSNRMKKLIEDLTEMSKANSGVIPVCPQELVLQETIRQALGEFSDKLDAAGLTVVCRMPQEELCLQADGKLLWRVLSNLLSNACKYSLAGTRLYVDVTEGEGLATIRLRNISREELSISEEELMERFVRGDASRNTEGSGLGLNIARSLMELQKGTLDITLDGDLFTATMTIPLH